MVFSGLTFLLLFLPLLLGLYFISGNIHWRNGVLVLFSLFFMPGESRSWFGSWCWPPW